MGQNLGHLNFFSFSFFFVTESLVFEQQILCRVDSLCNLRPLGLVPVGWCKGSISRTS